MKTRTEMHSSSPMSDPSFSGWYAQAGYVLTGENRGFKPEAAVFTNPRPTANAFDDGGIGAVEVAARYSTIDLNDGRIATGGIEGGELDVWTLGLNWYLNPNLRVMTDYSRIDLDDVLASLGRGGVANVVQIRLQVAF
jgi:phosphate-selective porin OprO/OprP